jgi:hypothetical protein
VTCDTFFRFALATKSKRISKVVKTEIWLALALTLGLFRKVLRKQCPQCCSDGRCAAAQRAPPAPHRRSVVSLVAAMLAPMAYILSEHLAATANTLGHTSPMRSIACRGISYSLGCKNNLQTMFVRKSELWQLKWESASLSLQRMAG